MPLRTRRRRTRALANLGASTRPPLRKGARSPASSSDARGLRALRQARGSASLRRCTPRTSQGSGGCTPASNDSALRRSRVARLLSKMCTSHKRIDVRIGSSPNRSLGRRMSAVLSTAYSMRELAARLCPCVRAQRRHRSVLRRNCCDCGWLSAHAQALRLAVSNSAWRHRAPHRARCMPTRTQSRSVPCSHATHRGRAAHFAEAAAR